MTTQSQPSIAFRFLRIVLAAAVLALGSSAQAASTNVLIDKKVAESAARIVCASNKAQQYNAAYVMARDLTANTGSQNAAANAALLLNSLPSKQQLTLLPAILQGVAQNYPNQYASIVTHMILANNNTRDNASQILASISSTLSYDSVAQIAVGINYGMRRDKDMLEKAQSLSFNLLMSVNNSASGTALEKANEMGIVAGNLISGLMTPDRNGRIPKANLKAIDQVSNMLAAFAKTVDTGGLTRDQLIHNMIGQFASTIKASVPPGSNSSQIAAASLQRILAVIVKQLPNSAALIYQIIQFVLNSPVGAFTPVGGVTSPETPH